MKDLYTDHETGDEPTGWSRFCSWLEYSAPVMFFYRLINGGDHFCGFKYLPRNVEWFFQKHMRGYSDCDLWCLDERLGQHIIKCLQAFKDMPRMGYPGDYNKDLMKNPGVKSSKQTEKQAVKNWNADLQDMIDGFKFLTTGIDDYYTVCLKKYPDNSEKRLAMYNKGIEEAQVKATKFITHFNSLWD